MSSIAFITGATSGIGAACARLFARQGYDLLLNGRRAERLQDLAKELQEQYPVKIHLLPFDVRDRQQVREAVGNLPSGWKNIGVLVNNAGLALGFSPIQEGEARDWETMIDTNVKGLLYVTKAVAPLMIAAGEGQIVNLGSIAGKQTYPNGNVYCATKKAVEALTEGMRIDLLPHGIKVTSVNPGAVETEFSVVRFKGDQERAGAVYEGFDPLTAEDIAEVIYFAASRPAHVTINDLTVMPTAQATATIFHRRHP